MSQPSEGSQPSTAPHDQPGGSREPARGRKRRAPAWSSAEIVDLIEVWGEASNVHDLRTSHRNAAVYGRMAASLAARGHQRSREQVRCKIKDLRQSYSRACLPGADPEACPHFHALDRILGPHAVPAPRDVIDPGAEGPLLDTEEEEEGSESQEPAASLPRTRDPRGTPQSRSPASSEAGEASTSAAPGTAGRTTPPAAAARARASRTARNQEDYQRRHLRFLDRQLRLQDHWVQEDLRLRQRREISRVPRLAQAPCPMWRWEGQGCGQDPHVDEGLRVSFQTGAQSPLPRLFDGLSALGHSRPQGLRLSPECESPSDTQSEQRDCMFLQ
ncbi:uncharacterized protein LOC142823704 [Pelodiscus sinensis]|uniref:uncharacterized protein LOC142823704 n=1 Tax=Pelodiscus sinensis TaxID=13735 RepID=UPI003F6C40FD